MPTTNGREHYLIADSPFATLAAYREATGEPSLAVAWQRGRADVLRAICRANLRGRGGAGFPTGTKWTAVYEHPCKTHYAVCNAAEGEPGTFKDRWLLRNNPYAVIEGLLIAAYVVGARRAFIGIKATFRTEIDRLHRAIAELEDEGLLADLELAVVEGPDEYLFGEEKALLEVLEGNGPLPREAHYPPYEYGLFATPLSPNPTLVNNVETLAHVPSIIRHGADSFLELGTEDTPGTILFTVSGDIAGPGVYEREAGITLRELFYDVAGGPLPGRELKLALSGVGAGIIPADKFDARADFGSLQRIGSGLGSAGFVVYDDSRSVPRIAQTVARFLYVESCNQCSACKEGLRTASNALDALFEANGASEEQVSQVGYGARMAPQGNRCYLPVQASVLLPSLLGAFPQEFEALVAQPDTNTQRLPIPKLVDFDVRSRSFVLDPDQRRKLPDWTYEDPAPDRPPARPITTPAGPASTPFSGST